MNASLGSGPLRGLLIRGASGGLLALALTSGCAGALDQAARTTTTAAIQAGVDEVADPGMQRRVAESLDPAALEKTSRRVTAAVVDGSMAALAEPERRERVGELLESMDLPTMVAQMGDRMLAGAVDSSIAAAGSERNRATMRLLVRDLVDEAVRTSVTVARDELGDTESTERAVGGIARLIAKEATLGFQDAVDQARYERETGITERGEGGVLVAAARAAESSGQIAVAALIGLAVLALGLIGLVIVMFRRSRLLRHELEVRDQTLVRLTDATSSSIEGEPATNARPRTAPSWPMREEASFANPPPIERRRAGRRPDPNQVDRRRRSDDAQIQP